MSKIHGVDLSSLFEVDEDEIYENAEELRINKNSTLNTPSNYNQADQSHNNTPYRISINNNIVSFDSRINEQENKEKIIVNDNVIEHLEKNSKNIDNPSNNNFCNYNSRIPDDFSILFYILI
jgi:hypothetical protein